MSATAGLTKPRFVLPGPVIASVAVVALIALAIATGGPVIVRQVVSGLLLGAIYMTVAVAFTLTIGVLNFLNFTIPSLFMLGGLAVELVVTPALTLWQTRVANRHADQFGIADEE